MTREPGACWKGSEATRSAWPDPLFDRWGNWGWDQVAPAQCHVARKRKSLCCGLTPAQTRFSGLWRDQMKAPSRSGGCIYWDLLGGSNYRAWLRERAAGTSLIIAEPCTSLGDHQEGDCSHWRSLESISSLEPSWRTDGWRRTLQRDLTQAFY